MGQGKSGPQRMRDRAVHCGSARAVHTFLRTENMHVNSPLTVAEGETGTPLWLAAKYNDVDLARLLLSEGARVNQPSGSLCMTPLHMAAYRGSEAMVELLLQHGACVDVLDKWDYSPLMYVAVQEEPMTVLSLFTLLLSAGCDVNYGATLDSQGRLQHACSRELQALGVEGMDGVGHVHVKEPLGAISGTALHLVAQNPHLPNSRMQLLLEAGADINSRNLHGQTPLMRTFLDTYYDYHSNVRAHAHLLVSLGARLEPRDVRGWTCFHYAAQRGSIECLELLLEHSADCNVLAESCDTHADLHSPLSSQACIDSQQDPRISPIWLLLVHGWRDASRYLLLNGCDVNTPLSSRAILYISQNVNVCRYGDILPLEFVLCNKWYSLAKLMVKNGCQVEDCSYTGSCQDEGYTQFIAYIQQQRERSEQVQGLRELCKGAVRACMRQGILVKCRRLGLPTVLYDFICDTEGGYEAWGRPESTWL